MVKIGNKNYTDGIGWINVGFLIIGTSPHRRVNQRESPTAQLEEVTIANESCVVIVM